MFFQRVFILGLTLFGLLFLIGCTAVQPVAPPTEMPVSEPTETPVPEDTATPVPEATEEPAAEVTEEPTVEVTEEPTMEATEEPAAEATEEPAAEATEEPVSEDAAAEEPVTEQIKLDFVIPLSTIEEVEDIENLLHDVEGIVSVRGTEIGLTITYDPEILTPDDVRRQMTIIGFPVKP